MNWETKITIYKFTPQVFTLTRSNPRLSAEPTGQTRTVRGQKPTNQRFVGFLLPISLVSKTTKGLEKT